MLLLDLFCGTKSLKELADNKGYEYIGLDIEPQFKPEILVDFLEWDYKSVNPDFIWASPDCAVWSLAATNVRHFDKDRNPLTEKALIQIKVIDRLKECINYHLNKNPNLYYFIENPTAKLSWVLTEYPSYKISYCQYGFHLMKPTTIWTNKPFIPKKCKRNEREKCHHIKAPRGSNKGITAIKNKINRYKIPYGLLEELFLGL